MKTINDLGFTSPSKYVKAFDKKLKDYVKALGILEEDADAMRSRAALCSPLTSRRRIATTTRSSSRSIL